MFLTLSYKYSVSVHKHVMVGGFWARYSKSDEKPDIYRCIYKYIYTRYVAARQLGGTDLGRKLKVKN